MGDIKNATNSRGQKVFASTTRSSADFKLAGEVGSKIGDFFHAVCTSDVSKDAITKIIGTSPAQSQDVAKNGRAHH